MRCTDLLWRAILKPFRFGCSHIDKKCGHVSMSFLWHNVQLGLLNLRGPKMFFFVITHVLSLFDIEIDESKVDPIVEISIKSY